MIYREKDIDAQAAMNAAIQVCAAARTAPKARGIDYIHTMALNGEEKDALARELRRLGKELNLAFYLRDADNLEAAQAVALIGVEKHQRGLGDTCDFCGMGGCSGCAQKGGLCAFDSMDLGIALGSAAALAADLRMDSRMMYSVGKAALSLNLFEDKCHMVIALPLSVSGKSPFFDRKPKT